MLFEKDARLLTPCQVFPWEGSSRIMAHRTTVGHVHLFSRWVRIALSPSSPLKFRTAGFPQYGFKAGLSDRAFPGGAIASHQFASVVRALRGHRVPSLNVEALGSVWHRHSSGLSRSAPGALAPVRVILSRSINAYRPHPTHSQAHPNFAASGLYAVPSLFLSD